MSSRFRPTGGDWIGSPPETFRRCSVSGKLNAKQVVEFFSQQASKLHISADNTGTIRYSWSSLPGGRTAYATFVTGDKNAIPEAAHIPGVETLQLTTDSKRVGQNVPYPNTPSAAVTEAVLFRLLDREMESYISVQ